MIEIVTALLLAGLRRGLHGLVLPQSWLFTLGQRRIWPTTNLRFFINKLLNPLLKLCIEINKGSGECFYLPVCVNLTSLPKERLYLKRLSQTSIRMINRRMLIERMYVFSLCRHEVSTILTTTPHPLAFVASY
jgi:hypothetical protein